MVRANNAPNNPRPKPYNPETLTYALSASRLGSSTRKDTPASRQAVAVLAAVHDLTIPVFDRQVQLQAPGESLEEEQYPWGFAKRGQEHRDMLQ